MEGIDGVRAGAIVGFRYMEGNNAGTMIAQPSNGCTVYNILIVIIVYY